jgi:hypothetical protein
MQIAYPHVFEHVRGVAQFGGGCGIGKEQTAFGVSHDNNVVAGLKEHSVVHLVLGQVFHVLALRLIGFVPDCNIERKTRYVLDIALAV